MAHKLFKIKSVLIFLIVFVSIVTLLLVYFSRYYRHAPFSNLTIDSLEKVTYLDLHNRRCVLTQEETAELVTILNNTVVRGRATNARTVEDWFGWGYDFLLTDKTGKQTSVIFRQPFITINDKDYWLATDDDYGARLTDFGVHLYYTYSDPE